MAFSAKTAVPEVLHEYRQLVDRHLTEFTEFGAGCPEVLQKAIRHSLLAPGKRLRPALVLMAAESCGAEIGQAIPAACAVEMIHTYSLIHDDLPAMDDDDMRRGLPSCHAAYGEATAILAGDALLALAFETLTQLQVPPEIIARCCRELAHAAGATQLVGGQADDLAAEFAEIDEQRLIAIHERKTGAMFRASLGLGGLVAQTGEEQLAALDGFGSRLGLAFQIVDDLLDLQGDENILGKRTQKDAEHGKLTFPAVLGIDQSRERAEQLAAEACGCLAPLGERAGGLQALMRYVVERNQ